MRRTTSIHIEEDFLNEIAKYQADHNLKSRNQALERMLLERRILMEYNSNKNNIPNTTTVENKPAPIAPEEKNNKDQNDKMKDILNSIYSSMPEGDD